MTKKQQDNVNMLVNMLIRYCFNGNSSHRDIGCSGNSTQSKTNDKQMSGVVSVKEATPDFKRRFISGKINILIPVFCH